MNFGMNHDVGNPWDMKPVTVHHEPSGFPILAVPDGVQAAIYDVWSKTQAPLPLVATSAFSALSIASQHLFDAGRPNGMTSPCSLFFLTIADSGERKTSSDRYFTQPIREFERRHAEENRAAHQTYATDRDIWRVKEQGLKLNIQRLASRNKPTAEAEQQLRQHQEHPPVQPASMRLLFDDVSPTAIITSLHDHWPSVGILSDEAGKLFNGKTFDNIGLFNKLWDGDMVALDRHRTSGSYAVRGGRLTMSLMSQQKTLQDFLNKQGNLARDNGFLARCLTCWPPSTQGTRLIRQLPVPDRIDRGDPLADFHRTIAQLLLAAWQRHQDGGGRITVPMSDDAAQAWTFYYNAIEPHLGAYGVWGDIKDGAAKAAENIARLACLFAAFESVESPEKTMIQSTHVHAAEMICRWYMGHFKAIFGEDSVLSSGVQNSEKLLAWLQSYWMSRQVPFVHKSDLIKYGPYCVRKAKHLDEALQILERRHVVLLQSSRLSTGRLSPLEVWDATYRPPPPPIYPQPYAQPPSQSHPAAGVTPRQSMADVLDGLSKAAIEAFARDQGDEATRS